MRLRSATPPICFPPGLSWLPGASCRPISISGSACQRRKKRGRGQWTGREGRTGPESLGAVKSSGHATRPVPLRRCAPAWRPRPSAARTPRRFVVRGRLARSTPRRGCETRRARVTDLPCCHRAGARARTQGPALPPSGAGARLSAWVEPPRRAAGKGTSPAIAASPRTPGVSRTPFVGWGTLPRVPVWWCLRRERCRVPSAVPVAPAAGPDGSSTPDHQVPGRHCPRPGRGHP